MTSNHLPGEPEYLGTGSPTSPRSDGSEATVGGTGGTGGTGGSDGPSTRRGRRTGVLAVAAVGVLAAVGAGTYGVVQLMAGGSSPASAVPATAIGYVSLDLDPSAAQKIEAIKILRKFPSLRSQLHVGSRDDLRRAVFRQVQEEGGCTDLDYAQDIAPWIGERVAVAAVPASGHRVVPLVALQVTDQDAARTGVRKLAACADQGTLGAATSGDYVLLTEKQRDADAMATSAGSAALADDTDFTAWMDRTGDPGIVTMYAAKDAGDVVAEAAGSAQGGTLLPSRRERSQLTTALKDFGGAAGVLRFHDGAVEAEFSAKGLGTGVAGGDRRTDVSSLPATTGAVLAFALQDGWADTVLDQLRSAIGAGPVDAGLRDAEQQTGLDLPEDVETLLGRSVSVAVDSSLDPRSLDASPDPSQVPAGIRITGDPAKITAVIDKIKKAAGPAADVLRVATSGDTVAVGTDQKYLDTLVRPGELGDSEQFGKVVSQSDRASGVFYLDFDAGDGWAEQVAELVATDHDEAAAKADVAPLDALGLSAWQDGDRVQHALVRLTTD
jgi:hypothetical protein